MNAVVQHREAAAPAEVIRTDATSLMEVISRAASDPNTDVDKLERLMTLYERITGKQAEAQFNEAMNAAQATMRRVGADKHNKQTNSDYATYAAIDRMARPIYTQHGFSLSFNTEPAAQPDYIRVTCKVAHSNGHAEHYGVDMPADGKGAKGGDVMTKTHATGSAMTYGQRYLMKLIFNLAIGEDDDGNSAGWEPITQDQVDDLNALMEEVGADRRRFLNFFKVDGLSSIQTKDYPRALAMLQAKRSR